MGSLSFDSGLKTVDINGKGEITFNPTDVFLMKRITDAAMKLDETQKELEAKHKGCSGLEFFDVAAEYDAKMREIINGIFDEDVSYLAFGKMSVFAIGDGFPIWANFIFALYDMMDDSAKEEAKKTNPRIEKYMKKYHK